ncbi:MAG: EF-P lysine aminoacylase EpmA [Pirellulales bacterium]
MSSRAINYDIGPSASLAALQQRATLLRKLREFFDERGFLEVETPLLAPEVIPELHIEPMRVGDCPLFLPCEVDAGCNITQEKGTVPRDVLWYLQASPELHMKRLLAAGATAIYQVTRSFRNGECGQLHNPEFTIVEWYRVGDDMQAGMDLLDALAQSLLGTPPALRTTYANAFEQHLGLNAYNASADELATATANAKVAIPDGINRSNRDEWLNLLLATRIEPQLGRDRPEILYHYPASQSSLAQVISTPAGHQVAERFELYYRGIELANGFHELVDATELRRRLEAVNVARVADGRRVLPMPERLLAAMERGLPPCTGCALGIDRLTMLALGTESIDEVIAFPQDRA